MARDRLQSHADDQPVTVVTKNPAYLWSWYAWKTQQPHSSRANVNHIIGFARGGEIIGVVVYSAYRHSSIEIHIYTEGRAWCNRRTLKAIFEYPFVELGLNRVTATSDPAIPAVCNFIERIGFIQEGRLRKILPSGGDQLIYGMMRSECRWIDT